MTDTYSQLKRTGKAPATDYISTFKMLRQLPARHYKNDGNPYDASLYRTMVCEIGQIDDGWNEFGKDWQHYWCWDESETVTVTMEAGQAEEGAGWYTICVRWVNNPANVRGYIVEKIESTEPI